MQICILPQTDNNIKALKFKKTKITYKNAHTAALQDKKAKTYTSAILTLSSPTDDVFDFLQNEQN